MTEEKKKKVPTCEGFRAEFAALAITLPPSVKKSTRERLIKKGFDPAIEQSSHHTELIMNTLKTAQKAYAVKREKAREASVKKRAEREAQRKEAEREARGTPSEEEADNEILETLGLGYDIEPLGVKSPDLGDHPASLS